jgi:hypothetical protein
VSNLPPWPSKALDSRPSGLHPVSGTRALVERTPDGQNVRVYCVSCHHAGGFVSAENVELVIYLCDQYGRCGCNCMETKGELTLPRAQL